MSEAAGRLDVVVPAHNEAALIGDCLGAVVEDADGLDVRVVVVANGCGDATAAIARAVAGVIVVELAVASKPAALNAANEHLRGVPVVYLDADTVITPGTLRALLTAMDQAGGPVMVGPRPVLVRSGDWRTRGFAAIWSRLPSVAGEVIGGGCYAVSGEGRRRWGDFPDVVADDGFVRSLFGPHERRVVTEGGFLLVLPDGPELSRVLARWRRGNAELGEQASPAAGGRSNARAVLAAPGLWRHVPAFLWVQIGGRLSRRRRWARAEGVRVAAGPRTASGDLVVVGDEAAADELRALAVRFPGAGLYGGPARRPGLIRAIALALGLTVSDQPAPVLLVRRDVLRRLGGPDPRFGAHGAVSDLCLRAERLGITPVSLRERPDRNPAGLVREQPDRHPAGLVRERPAGDPAGVLRDEILLHRKHLPRWAAGMAGRVLAARRRH